MIAVVQQPSVLVIILIIVLVVVAIGPRTYYRTAGYQGPPLDWLWGLVLLVIVLWLLGVI